MSRLLKTKLPVSKEKLMSKKQKIDKKLADAQLRYKKWYDKKALGKEIELKIRQNVIGKFPVGHCLYL